MAMKKTLSKIAAPIRAFLEGSGYYDDGGTYLSRCVLLAEAFLLVNRNPVGRVILSELTGRPRASLNRDLRVGNADPILVAKWTQEGRANDVNFLHKASSKAAQGLALAAHRKESQGVVKTTTDRDSTGVIRVSFMDTTIPVYVADGEPFVLLRAVCAKLGIDHSSQYTRVRNAAWAKGRFVVFQVSTADFPGGSAFGLHKSRFGMWLATLNAEYVEPSYRPILEQFQSEAADVLDAYFDNKPAKTGELSWVQREFSDLRQLILDTAQVAQAANRNVENMLEVLSNTTALAIGERGSFVAHPPESEKGASVGSIAEAFREMNPTETHITTDTLKDLLFHAGIIGDERFGFYSGGKLESGSDIIPHFRLNDEGRKFIHEKLTLYMAMMPPRIEAGEFRNGREAWAHFVSNPSFNPAIGNSAIRTLQKPLPVEPKNGFRRLRGEIHS